MTRKEHKSINNVFVTCNKINFKCTKITITDVTLNKYWQERQNTTKHLTEIKMKKNI